MFLRELLLWGCLVGRFSEYDNERNFLIHQLKMILGIILRNYKCYKGLHYIPCFKEKLENLNIIIGDNGVGKSSILQALDSFFNDGEWVINNDNKSVDVNVGVVLYVAKSKLRVNLTDKELSIINSISDAFWDVDIKSNGIYEKAYHDFFKQRDLLRENREEYVLLVLGRKYASHDYSFISFEKIVDNNLSTLSPKPQTNTVNNIVSKVVGLFSYLYIPVEATISEFLKLEAAGMQLLADKDLKNAISDALNDKRITRKNGNKRLRQLSIMEIINEKLEEYIMTIESDIQKIDSSYDFKPAYRQSTKLTSNHLANVIINAYYSKRLLKKDKKPISSLSSGEKRRALIDIIYVFLAKYNMDRQLVLAIDEPESSLHISRCYDQFRKIQSIATKCKQQLFVTTHWYGSLPVLKSGNLIHLQHNQVHSIFDVANYFEDRRNHPDDINLKSFFDLSASLISAYRNSECHWIIVEGVDDRLYLEYYLDDPKLQILPLSGCGNVRKVYEYLFTPISNSDQEIGKGNMYKILCLIDTDIQVNSINVSSKSKNNLLSIKRWNENNVTHEIDILPIENPNVVPTEIEEILEPDLFYSALKNCINMYGEPDELDAFMAFELDNTVKNSRIKGDYSMLNHLGNGRNMRLDKEVVLKFVDKYKHQIAKEYVCNPRTQYTPSWVKLVQEILNR